jgi:hypothetical protein
MCSNVIWTNKNDEILIDFIDFVIGHEGQMMMYK